MKTIKINFIHSIFIFLFLFPVSLLFAGPSTGLKKPSIINSGMEERCRDDVGSKHAVNGNGERFVFVRSCFNEEWWRVRKTVPQPLRDSSIVLIRDLHWNFDAELFMPYDLNNPSTKSYSMTYAAISDDGNYVTYVVDDKKETHIYLAAIESSIGLPFGAAKWVIQIDQGANGSSRSPYVSADGKYVVFESDATNLTAQTYEEKLRRIFLFERDTKKIIDVTPFANASSRGATISSDGSQIAFSSLASNLTPNDNNDLEDVFVYDVSTKNYSLASKGVHIPAEGADGMSYDAMISAQGKEVVYTSYAKNIYPRVVLNDSKRADVYLYDLSTRVSYLISSPEYRECKDNWQYIQSNGKSWGICAYGISAMPSWSPVISADGSFIVFVSYINDLIPTWKDSLANELFDTLHPWMQGSRARVLMRDMKEAKFYIQSAFAGKNTGPNFSEAMGWTHGYGSATFPSLSADGKTTLFETDISNLEDFNLREFKTSFGTPYFRNGLGARSPTDAVSEDFNKTHKEESLVKKIKEFLEW